MKIVNNIMLEKSKKYASLEAIKYVKSNTIIGVGTGTTIFYFINYLKKIRNRNYKVVSSSDASTNLLKKYNIPTIELEKVDSVNLYVDSADEVNKNLQMIKGGGGALTKEKIIASIANQFVCIVDFSKIVNFLGNFSLPMEIIPSAYKIIKKIILDLGACVLRKKNYLTDNGNSLIYVYNLKILNPLKLEMFFNSIPGIVTVGLFAKRKADILIVAKNKKIKIFHKN